MTIAVRFATAKDAQAVVQLGALYHKESCYKHIPYHRDRVVETFMASVNKKTHFTCLLAVQEDTPTGYMYGSVGKHLFSHQLGCTLHSMYVLPDRRGGLSAVKLMHAFKRWGQAQGATVFYFSVASDIRQQQTDRFLQKMGFTLTGGNYIAKI